MQDFSGQLDRRGFVALTARVGIVGGTAAVVGLPQVTGTATAGSMARWSQPSTWGGRVPARGADVTVRKPVLLDVSVAVNRLTIVGGAGLYFDPAASRTLSARGNVVVKGLLQMRPGSAAVRHLLDFPSVDEAAFVGGGMKVVDSDVGLWVMDGGALDLAGTAKVAWVRATAVAAGAPAITLAADPTGWRVGDELAITPTVSPASGDPHTAYDTATITSISGRRVGLSRATRFAHPVVDVGNGMAYGAEVLNLTRNVLVRGRPSGRTHVWIRSTRPQQVAYAELRHTGPRQADGDTTKPVLGRYGLHLHMAGDGSRGSKVTGAVVRDAGSHAFVPHGSHGVTFTSCISHNTVEDAFWYDGMVDTRTPGPDTNDAQFVSCVASMVKAVPAERGFRMGGFVLGAGSGNRARNCVAVGVAGTKDAAGFVWPEGPTSGVWSFSGNVAHNNAVNGIFTWQNTEARHVVSRFVCYHNGQVGLSHGAYANAYEYVDGYLFANRGASVQLHSVSRAGDVPPQRLQRLHCDGAGLHPHAVALVRHQLDAGQPTLVVDCTFLGQTAEAVAATYAGARADSTPDVLDLVDCLSERPVLWLRDDSDPGTLVRVQQDGSALAARVKTEPGTPRPDWNSSVRVIAPPYGQRARGTTARWQPPVSATPQAPAGSAALTVTPAVGARSTTTTPVRAHDHDHDRGSGLVDVRLEAGRVLVLENAGAQRCHVSVTRGGSRVLVRSLPLGASRTVLPEGAGDIVLDCHGDIWVWPAR